MLSKVSSIAVAIGLLVAIVAAFATIPYAALILVIAGVIGGLSVEADMRPRLIAAAILLTVGAKALDAIPTAGPYLTNVFTNIGAVLTAAALVAVAISLFNLTKNQWVKPAA